MKLAIITGGSRGLGEALKNQLKIDSYEVYDLSRSGKGENHITCDMSDFVSSQKVTNDLFVRLKDAQWEDILFINNAGVISPIKKVSELNDEEILQNITVNITSSIAILVKFLKYFSIQNCRKLIVNISSGAALKGYPGWSLYCASKASVENFIRSIAEEQNFKNDSIIAINYRPGVMDTAMQGEIRDSDESHFPIKERFVELKKTGSLRTADYVAEHLLELIKKELINGERYSVS